MGATGLSIGSAARFLDDWVFGPATPAGTIAPTRVTSPRPRCLSYRLDVLHDLSHHRLALVLRTALWVVLVLGLGNTWASLTLEPPHLHQAAGLVQVDTAQGGRVFLRARWMDPTSGRFVSEDPYEGDIEGPVSLHRYLYASNGPINRRDPSGRDDLGELSRMLKSIPFSFPDFPAEENLRSLA